MICVSRRRGRRYPTSTLSAMVKTMNNKTSVGDVLNVAKDMTAWYDINLPDWEAKARLWPGQCEHPSGGYVDLTELKKNNTDENRYVFSICDECGCIGSPDPIDPAVHQAPYLVKRFSAEQVSDLLRRSHWEPNMDHKFIEVSDEDWLHPTLTYSEYCSVWWSGRDWRDL